MSKQARSQVPETDDYLERQPPTEQDAPEPGPNPEEARLAARARHIFPPLATGTMVGCIAYAIAEFVIQVSGPWQGMPYFVIPIIAAFVGYISFHRVRIKFMSSNDRLRYVAFELAIIFLVLKVYVHLDDTPGELVAQVRTWATNPMAFFGTEVLSVYAIAVSAWWAARAMARDMDAATYPQYYVGEAPPVQRLSVRFFVGAAVLLAFSGLARLDLATLLQVERPRVPGLILNVLLYFLLGLALLGQLQYRRMVGIWQREKVKVAAHLGRHWLRYTLIFLGGITLLALLLPTGYTVGLLDIARTLIWAITYLISVLYFLLMFPLAFMLSLFMKEAPEVTAPAMSRPQFEPGRPPPATEPQAWWLWLRSVLFWGIALAALVYVVRGYLRDRPELLASLRNFAPLALLGRAWKALRHWWRGAQRRVREVQQRLARRLRRASRGRRADRLRRSGAESAREQLLHRYLNTLDDARAEGYPRGQSATPYEYRTALQSQVPEGEDAVSRLTEAFVKARYSEGPVTAEEVEQARADAEALLKAMREGQVDGKKMGTE